MAKLYTVEHFRDSLQLFVQTGDIVGAQLFFADEICARIQMSGLPMSRDTIAVASDGQKEFGDRVADAIIRRCVMAVVPV